jgi:hypothetical protein
MSIFLPGCPPYIGIKLANLVPHMRGKNLFKKTDMKRAIDTAREAGLAIDRVDITKDGGISIVVANSKATAASENPWDEVLIDAANEERPA